MYQLTKTSRRPESTCCILWWTMMQYAPGQHTSAAHKMLVLVALCRGTSTAAQLHVSAVIAAFSLLHQARAYLHNALPVGQVPDLQALFQRKVIEH